MIESGRLLAPGLGLILGLAASAVCAGPAPGQGQARVADGFRLAVVGDMIGPYAPVLERADPALISATRPLSEADVGVANVEGGIFDLETFEGAPAAENGGGTPLGSAAVARDLKALGVDLVSRANNHATDWGSEGLLATSRSLVAAGLVEAGAGPDLSSARAAAFLDTPGGRVGLVSVASTFTGQSPAADADGARRARPGISTLAVRGVQQVTADEMAALAAIAARQGGRRAPTSEATPDRVSIGGQAFMIGETGGMTWEADPRDRAAVLASLRDARAGADLLVFSIHAHESSRIAPDPGDLKGDRDADQSGRSVPADFLRPLFHAAIDAGADVVVRHGPHALEGVELYRGRPIFYGMASLFFDVGDADRRFGPPGREWSFPAEWDESAIAIVDYQEGRVAEIRLYPVVMRFETPERHGLPRPATPDEAARILARVQAQSARFGVELLVEDGVGVIRPPAEAFSQP